MVGILVDMYLFLPFSSAASADILVFFNFPNCWLTEAVFLKESTAEIIAQTTLLRQIIQEIHLSFNLATPLLSLSLCLQKITG